VVSAKTSTVGPGYHAHVVRFADRLTADLGLTWIAPDEKNGYGDETEYATVRDFSELQRQMLMWLGALAADVARHDGGGFSISLPVDPLFTVEAFSLTPMGPRPRTWWEAVRDDPTRGIDLFPWWEDYEGARSRLGLALSLMWTDVRWRKPLNEAEERVHDQVLEALESAWKEDPGLAYPWREWEELLELRERSDATAAVVRARSRTENEGNLIGYRRHPVRQSLAGGWSIVLPGDFFPEWDEKRTFSAGDRDRTVWFTGFVAKDDAEIGQKKEGREYFERQDGKLRSVASITREENDGDAVWTLQSETVLGKRLALVTVAFKDEASRSWAMSTWRSLDHSAKTE
jgi:hypothetical protein